MDLYTIRNDLNSGKTIYDLKLRVTYYARVSTEKDEQAHSLQNQIKYYSDFIKNNPNWVYTEGYIDEGISGCSVNKRESFLRMISDAKLRKFDFIVTKEISRFSRNTLDSIKYTQELLSYGVGVLFQSDNINTLMPDAELRLTIMSSIAQDEVRKISERVKFGFKRAVENGVVLGNSKIWGYTKENGKLIIDEKESEAVRKIFDMYATENIGIRGISSRLEEMGFTNSNGNPFSFSTIKNIITNPKYMGYYCGNKSHKYDYKLSDRKYLNQTEWVMYKDEENVPPIVSEEIWQKANYILKKRSEKQSSDDRTSYQNKYVYSGKIICSEHKVPYYRSLYRYSSGNKEVWQCKRYAEKGKEGCGSPSIYTTELNMIIKKAYDEIIINRSEIIHDMINMYSGIGLQSKIKEDIAKVQVEINQLLKMKDKLLELSINGRISDDEFEIRNNKFNNSIDSLNIRLKELKLEEIKNKEIGCSVETLRKLIAKELDFDEGFNNEIIESLLDRIEVYKTDNKNEIDLKIYFKVMEKPANYKVLRSRTDTSVCCNQYI
ncbi:DNA invertase Pin-like site-specific DNA recombinase [Ruminiclostridium sufflavum DSM 19573]|uniref:DNA invertase Pin-like site-specific DNA recombinase n=1 Tax=Ruminiclostridium sufflavum DSM 19573 TaxID=1121337 RepID=A0A318Y2H6_9FIRM|nr:recombinase family protein [Ruminiclostridium sufflavum]PYG89747.1 DNA invertase Pin-like site-specific DNA recombinase [Ruminiclostridium sufflavum DSM 19573]